MLALEQLEGDSPLGYPANGALSCLNMMIRGTSRGGITLMRHVTPPPWDCLPFATEKTGHGASVQTSAEASCSPSFTIHGHYTLSSVRFTSSLPAAPGWKSPQESDFASAHTARCLGHAVTLFTRSGLCLSHTVLCQDPGAAPGSPGIPGPGISVSY